MHCERLCIGAWTYLEGQGDLGIIFSTMMITRVTIWFIGVDF